MKCKKLMSAALAGIMTLSMAVPAMADNETVIEGGFEEIEIAVTVMPTGSAQINPYEMPVKAMDTQATPAQIENSSSVGMTLKTAGKIATQPLAMYNGTDSDLSVSATVSATNVTGVELTSKPITSRITAKQALVYLEVKQDKTLSNSEVTTAGAGTVGDIKGEELVNAFNNWEATTYNAASANQVLVAPEGSTTKKNLAIMTAADASGDPQTGSFVLYRLGGDCVEEPETPWAETDKFNVNVAFKFSPVKYTEVTGATAGTVTLTPNSIAASNTAEAKFAAPSGVTLSDDATYVWTVTNGTGTTFSISAGQGTNTLTIAAGSSGSSGDDATVSLVVTDGTTRYKPADVTISRT